MTKTWHDTHVQKMTISEKIADIITKAIASDISILLHTLAFIGSFLAVIMKFLQLSDMLLWLTTIVSLEAIYIGLFLQKSSNMSGKRDRENADADFIVNRESKNEIEILQKNLYRLETEKLDKILNILQQ